MLTLCDTAAFITADDNPGTKLHHMSIGASNQTQTPDISAFGQIVIPHFESFHWISVTRIGRSVNFNAIHHKNNYTSLEMNNNQYRHRDWISGSVRSDLSALYLSMHDERQSCRWDIEQDAVKF